MAVEVVALVARLNLAAAFALSAVAKLADGAGFARSLAAYGLSGPAPFLARALPAVEAALAVTLVAFPGGSAPAWAAVGVLVVFTAAVVANLVSGRSAPCPCFAARGARPTSAATVARNGVLLAVAVVATGDTAGAAALPTAAATAATIPATLFALRRFG